MSKQDQQQKMMDKEDRKASEWNQSQLSEIERASKWSDEQAKAAATRDIDSYMRARDPEAGIDPDGSRADFIAQEVGLRARGNATYRAEIEQVQGLPAHAKEMLTIGRQLPKADWAVARDIAGAGSNNGRVYLPKMHTDYAGKVVLVTDTHVIQRVSKNAVVAHDISRLQNRDEILQLQKDGTLQGKNLKMTYDGIKSNVEVISFEKQRAQEVQTRAADYAAQNIKSPAARETFLKHIEAMMTAEMKRERTGNDPVAPKPQQQKERAPAR